MVFQAVNAASNLLSIFKQKTPSFSSYTFLCPALVHCLDSTPYSHAHACSHTPERTVMRQYLSTCHSLVSVKDTHSHPAMHALWGMLHLHQHIVVCVCIRVLLCVWLLCLSRFSLLVLIAVAVSARRPCLIDSASRYGGGNFYWCMSLVHVCVSVSVEGRGRGWL